MRVSSKAAAIALLLVGIATAVTAESHDRAQWGPFTGRVLDADTEQPISGAVMLVVWRESAGPALLETRFYESKEALTDETGRWLIPRIDTGRMRVTVQSPSFRLFAAGYVSQARIVTPITGQAYLDDTVTRVKRLGSRQDLLTKSREYPSDIPPERMRAYLTAINAERSMLGMSPLPIPPSP